MESKHTPGPWFVQDDHGRRYIETYGNDDTIAEIHRRRNKGSVYSCAEAGANASLIIAAPDLLAALKYVTENEEQRVFEAWLQRTTPSGDCDSVHSQWLESSDYEDFCSAWEKQISAIAKATA
ncbi:hypothetical protein M1D68_16075 [Pseudomonas sp. R4-84]